MTAADMLRWVVAVEALALAVACAYALPYSHSVDQRLRFAVLGVVGLIVVGGHFGALGGPLRWQLPALVPLLAVALISIMIFVRREARARHDGD